MGVLVAWPVDRVAAVYLRWRADASGLTAYYNEIDPFAAAWLRNLIAAEHIMAGDVDERSIEDVAADDLEGFDRCHFFAGIAGWDLALQTRGMGRQRPVWTGSCPCQPLSSAGQRKGHVDERHLWPAFHRLIAECRPPTVFGEQVASKDGREWLSAVRADLERSGICLRGCRYAGCGRRGAAHQTAIVVGGRLRTAEKMAAAITQIQTRH